MLEKSFENKYNKNLEKLNTKENKDKKDLEINKHIIVKIDSNTGMIIDDRD